METWVPMRGAATPHEAKARQSEPNHAIAAANQNSYLGGALAGLERFALLIAMRESLKDGTAGHHA